MPNTQVHVVVPTPRISATLDAVNSLLITLLPPDGDHKAEPDEVLFLAFWMLRSAGRCLQRTVDCVTFTEFAHQAYHQAEEVDLNPDELMLKRYDTEDEPRH